MKRKFLSVLLCFCMVLTLAPSALAESAELTEAISLAGSTVEQLSGSINGVTTAGAETMNVTVTAGAVLEYSPYQAASGGTNERPAGWYVGIRIVAPTALTDANVANAKFANSRDYKAKSFDTAKDGKTSGGQFYLDAWPGLPEADLQTMLANGQTQYTRTYKLDWDGNTITDNHGTQKDKNWFDALTADQTVTVVVDLSNTKLMKDGQQVWPVLEGSATQSTEHCFSVKNGSDTKYYVTIEKAMAAAQNDATITLLKDVQDGGIQTTNTGKTLTFDFNSHTYACGTPAAGSTNTKSQGCQILRGNTVTMKNGTLSAQDGKESDLKTLIQNYGKLTLENMTLDGTNLGVGNYGGVGFPSNATFTLNSYNDVVTLSNVTIKNSENNATNAYSIGCGWWGATGWYPSGTQITINNTCTLENVLVYRDDKNQPTDVKSSITDGATTISAPWTGEGCDVEYMYDKTAHKLIAKADVATLTVEAAELTDADKTQLGITSSLGTYEVKANAAAANTYKITGSASYVEIPKFNESVSAENKGHYVALKVTSNTEKITVVNKSAGAAAPAGKEITLKTDGAGYSDTLVVWLDGERADNEAKQFTISAGTGAGAKTLVCDFSELTLLPKAAAGSTVTVEGTGADAAVKVETPNIGSVAIPEESSDGGLVIEVKAVADADKASVVPADATVTTEVKTAITGSDSKMVKVTVKDEAGQEQFTDTGALQTPSITVTISGLTGGTTYYVFCITGSAVTRVGTKTLAANETSLAVKTKHLSSWVAVPEPADPAAKAALDAVAADAGASVDGGSSEPAPGTGLVYKVENASGLMKYKVTVGGFAADAECTIQVRVEGKNGPVFYTKANNKGIVNFGVPTGSTVDVWSGTIANASDANSAEKKTGTITVNDQAVESTKNNIIPEAGA